MTYIGQCPYVPVKPVCDALGFDSEAQRIRLHTRLPELREFMSKSMVKLPSGVQQEMFCIHIELTGGWLASLEARDSEHDYFEALKNILHLRQVFYDYHYQKMVEYYKPKNKEVCHG